MAETKPENKEKEISEYELVQVPTAFGLAIQTPEGKQLTTEQAIVVILNKIEAIKKSVA